MAEPIEPLITQGYSELTDRETQRAISFLKAVWKLGACRTCGNAHYELMGLVVLRMVNDVEYLSTNGHKRPTASVTCAACGEVRFLDLVIAGVRPRDPGNPHGPQSGPSGGPFR